MDTNQRTMKARLGVLAVAVAFLLLAVPATAHQGTNHGTIKVHDDLVTEPEEKNEPQVDCDFWIEGFNMAQESGTLLFFEWPPTGDKSEVANDTWIGTPETEGEGFHFLNGPYSFDSGHYRVEAYLDEGKPGNTDHFSKAKMFWVDCGEPPEIPEEPEEGDCPDYDLVATAQPDGSILLTFNDVPDDIDQTNIYRFGGGETLQQIGSVGPDATSFLDTNTTVGETYTYVLTAETEGEETGACDRASATAIPVFPSLAAGALAMMGAVGAYAGLRRRG